MQRFEILAGLGADPLLSQAKLSLCCELFWYLPMSC